MTSVMTDVVSRVGEVAVIVPAFNAAGTLEATLASAIVEPGVAEIVVIDDGSKDRTLEVARRHEPAVRVLTGPNRGVSAARNRGLAETTAEWIIFLDSDDLLTAGTVTERLDVAHRTDAEVVICDWEDITDDGSGEIEPGKRRCVDWPALEHDAELATAVHLWATTAAILYRRSLVEKIGGFRPDLPVIQDARLLFDAARQGARFAHAPHVGARYRILVGSLSRRNPARFWEDVLLNGRQIEEHWRARGMDDEAHISALHGIYDCVARGLFDAGHPKYFEAVEAQRKLDLPDTRHARVAEPLARWVGLKAARRVLSILPRPQ